MNRECVKLYLVIFLNFVNKIFLVFENRNCILCMNLLNSIDFWICLFCGYNVLLVFSN